MVKKQGNFTSKLLILTIFSILIVACSSDSGTDGKQATSSDEGTPQKGGEAVIANVVDISSYDPILGSTDADQVMLWPVFDTLVTFTPDLELEPGLAESWEMPDDKTIILQLKEGVTFHDGTEFDAEAVKFNLERANSEEAKVSELKNIESVEVIDPLTVQLNLGKADATILAALTDRGGMMVSPSAVEKYGDDFAQNPVGAGPYKMVKHVPNGEVILEAYEDYWDEGKPYLDQITVKIIPDENTQINALKSGELDFAYRISPGNVDSFEGDPNLIVKEGTALPFKVISLNKSMPPFDNKEVRKALLHGINREAIIQAINFGKGEPAHQPYPQEYWAADPELEIDYNPEKAKQLLKDSGVDNPSFTMVHRSTPYYGRIAEAIQSQLQDIGFEVNLEPMEIVSADGNFFVDQKSNAYLTIYTGRVDPQQAVELLFSGESFYNVGGQPHSKIDSLISEASTVYDQEERASIYREISKETILEEAIQVPLIFSPRIAAMKDELKGFEHNLLGKPLYSELWKEQ